MTTLLADGTYDVPAGKLAVVVTHLEMTSPAPQRPVPEPTGVTFEHVTMPDPAWYRDLFLRVGGLQWLWTSRLIMPEDDLRAILHAPTTELYTLQKDGQAEALLELSFAEPDTCELAFFGVTEPLIGSGSGRYLMNRALDIVWARPVQRFKLHTCSLDHPAALSFYLRSGFTATARQVEIADDPRLVGDLPKSTGAHIPMCRPGRS